MRAESKPQSIPGVMLLRAPERDPEPGAEPGVARVSESLLELSAAAGRAGLSFCPDSVDNRQDFLDRLRTGTFDVIVVGPYALPDLELSEILERARSAQPSIPVILTGDSEAFRPVRADAADVLRSPEKNTFPTTLACALRVRQAAVQQAGAQQNLERTAVTLRENQKLITIGRLAASIAHEINNPLESVTNLLYLIGEEQDVSPSASSYLTLARRELDRVAQISRQTLNFSRETTGLVRAHIHDLLEEVLSLYSRRIMDKNLRVQRQYDCAEESAVYPGETRQVLSNLVTNAIEASSPKGLLRVRVRCTRSWSDPGVRGVRVSIGDSGSGIAPDVQRRLGEPFFTTKGQRGTGLGLWVTRSIIQRYGGEIQLRSSVDPRRHGTVFSIFLPTNLRPQRVDRPQNEAPGETAPRTNTAPSSQHSAHRPSAEDSPRRTVNGH